LLLKAAKRLEPIDQKLARETYLEALTAVFFPGILTSGATVLETARAVRGAPTSSAPGAPDLLLDGLALLITEGHDAGIPTLRRAVNAFRREDISREEGLRWLWLACRAAALLWDDEAWDVLSTRFIQLARDAGALTVLPLALITRSTFQMFVGDLAVAASLIEEVAAVNAATGSSFAPYAALALVALQGSEADASELIKAATNEVVHRREGGVLTFVHWATAVLHNGLGRYEAAVGPAEQAGEASNAVWFHNWGLVELIEAAARSGKTQLAADALVRLSETTVTSGTDWALGVEARSRALLSDGEVAETFYRQAVEALEPTRVRVELARAHLLYGEWLRRERRRLDAREQLRSAHDLFSQFGMEAFAHRARIELEATGEHPRKRAADTRDDLTPQEAQISRIAAEGATNQEIAAQLFISPSTVDYHLRKAFRKLGVKSRTQLARHVLEHPTRVEPAREP
jgi:DNA-binding CsgD family transcriptional regulator